MKKLIVVLCFLLLFGAVGCKSDEKYSDSAQTGVVVFYLNAAEEAVVTEDFVSDIFDAPLLLPQLLEKMRNPVGKNHKSAIPEKVNTPQFELQQNGLVTLMFDESYQNVTGIREVLMRAAIVKTICRALNVESVEFYVEGQPLMGLMNKPVGRMKDEDFVDNTGEDTYYFQKMNATLYFTNASGDMLYVENEVLSYSGTQSEAEVVLKRLLEGPKRSGLYPLFPEHVKLLGVSIKDGTCTVNFNSAFLEKLAGVKEEIVIYAVVNTLSELPNVHKVAFLIEGEPHRLFHKTDISAPLERNLNLVKME